MTSYVEYYGTTYHRINYGHARNKKQKQRSELLNPSKWSKKDNSNLFYPSTKSESCDTVLSLPTLKAKDDMVNICKYTTCHKFLISAMSKALIKIHKLLGENKACQFSQLNSLDSLSP